MKVFRVLLLSTLAISASFFVVTSIHRPLVGDSAQVHYICFLMDHGMAPYKVAQDMNMPGALALESLVIHTIGPGSLAWRCFDLLLLAAGKEHRFAGLGAGLLFMVLHGVDGINDVGERDLSMAVFVLLSYACLFHRLQGLRIKKASAASDYVPTFGFSFFAGAAASLKPTVLPLVLLLLAAFVITSIRHARRTLLPAMLAVLAGLCVSQFGAALLLYSQGATSAFLHGLRTVVPYYASLEHKPFSYLLLHSISP